ncbi:MAG: DUF1501 domain-containing protein, partial [Planctomycetaceae bacterium]|nr:DUF1501 domain-containing protein [Planctomycetaceae bacterium]
MNLFSRRETLTHSAAGFGMLGLASMFHAENRVSAAESPSSPLAPRSPHFEPRAKHVIFLFMNGGPSHVDTFDYKPALEKHAGESAPGGKWLPSPFRFQKQGQSGIEVSELYPHLSTTIDDLCVIRSMYTSTPNHEPGLFMMNSGTQQPTRPCMGSWLTYGLGTENQSLPGFVVLCPGKPVVGPALWSNSFLPGIFQGTHINNGNLNPKQVIGHIDNRHLSSDAQRRLLDLMQKLNHHHLEERVQDNQLEARIESLEM